MVQTRIEEQLEVFDQEIAGLEKESSKMPVIEASLSEITKNLELMRLQTEKQQQLLLELNAKERSMMSERLTESTICDSSTTKGKESEATSKDIRADRNIKEGRNEKKSKNDENVGDRNKFKKVEMPIFNGEDHDSWLFRTERYFHIHKLTYQGDNTSWCNIGFRNCHSRQGHM
ncbi:histone-lysine N-methyltransferase ASHR1 isoform X3 [Cucumis melo var. makuwa]|uniref:Histone-lysine N-methyltransferase ASHR1 isoform X3 n=1 Tax=Cucumis melo var. makuwa TaxID=1194695 RepID=A0A5D3C474_CUCMM|nr:histone-lysine N-methyltransferase ASHR1 isoform X3 [Cucumis melo var. makuwa]